MKGKSQGFRLKLMGGLRRKRLEKYENSNVCLWREICVYEWGKEKFLIKADGRCPTTKAGKLRKKQLVFMKGNMRFWTEKARLFWVKLIGDILRKILEIHEPSNLYLWKGICAHKFRTDRFENVFSGTVKSCAFWLFWTSWVLKVSLLLCWGFEPWEGKWRHEGLSRLLFFYSNLK